MMAWWLIPVLAIIAAGLITLLLIAGARGRYVGGEPRCRRCGYQLTGLQSERCPECGLTLDQRNIVYGRRRYRWALLAIGFLLWGVWVSGQEHYLGTLGRIQWIRLMPVSTLLRNAKTGNSAALLELVRRSTEGDVSVEQASCLANTLLERDVVILSESDAKSWSLIREAVEIRDGFNDEQKTRAYARFAEPSLQVRSPIRQGDPLILWLTYQSARSQIFTAYGFWELPKKVAVAGRTLLEDNEMSAWETGHADWYRDDYAPVLDKVLSLESDGLPVGIAGVEYRGRQVLARWSQPAKQRELVWSRNVSLACDVEVLPPDAPDPVDVVNDPAVHDVLQDSMYIYLDNPDGSITFPPCDEGETGAYLTCVLNNPTEMDLAFRVVLRAGEYELPTETRLWQHFTRRRGQAIVVRPGAHVSWEVLLNVPCFTASEVTLILRSDPDVARRTPDVFKMWGGELTYGPYKVRRADD